MMTLWKGAYGLLHALPPDSALLAKGCSSWKRAWRLQMLRRACSEEQRQLCPAQRGALTAGQKVMAANACRHMCSSSLYALLSSPCQPVRQLGMSAGRSLCSGTAGTLVHPQSSTAPRRPWARVPLGRPPALVSTWPGVPHQATAARLFKACISGMLLLHVLLCT